MSIAHVYKSKNRHRMKKMNKTMIVTNTVINYKLTYFSPLLAVIVIPDTLLIVFLNTCFLQNCIVTICHHHEEAALLPMGSDAQVAVWGGIF